MVDAQIDRPTHKRHRPFVGHRTKVVAEPLGAKGDHRDRELGFAPATARAAIIFYQHNVSFLGLIIHLKARLGKQQKNPLHKALERS
jgi:hypothetical protein